MLEARLWANDTATNGGAPPIAGNLAPEKANALYNDNAHELSQLTLRQGHTTHFVEKSVRLASDCLGPSTSTNFFTSNRVDSF